MTSAAAARMRPSTEETRIKIMQVAERLFGEQGIETVALRTIATTAKQRNTFSVQYHFGDRLGLLKAIFEYREAQLDRVREGLMEARRQDGQPDDIRWLLRACFYPNFLHFVENDGLPYIRLHFQYLANLRPRGVQHPVDYDSPSTVYLREVMARMKRKLSFLSREEFHMRLESVGAMFLGAIMQHAARPPESAAHYPSLFETLLEMMAAAMTVPPWDFSRSE